MSILKLGAFILEAVSAPVGVGESSCRQMKNSHKLFPSSTVLRERSGAGYGVVRGGAPHKTKTMFVEVSKLHPLRVFGESC